MDLTDDQIERYSRHMLLREIGGAGQIKLLTAEVFLLGLGAMGSVVALYLAAAGVGRLTLADRAIVSPTSPGAAALYTRSQIGLPKAHAAAEALHGLNPGVQITPLVVDAHPNAPLDLPAGCGLVVDGSNAPELTPMLDAVCRARGIPLLVARHRGWRGEVLAPDARGAIPTLDFTEGLSTHRQPEVPESSPPATETAAFAPPGTILAGLVASVAATEALKRLLGLTPAAASVHLTFDARAGIWERPCASC
ncbi:MAG: ThiF family adenylyltransferase [Magnetococcales bacterium]|nr:ThiF family adenylyltransferase [Magnetococcales bacterium]